MYDVSKHREIKTLYYCAGTVGFFVPEIIAANIIVAKYTGLLSKRDGYYISYPTELVEGDKAAQCQTGSDRTWSGAVSSSGSYKAQI